MRKERPNDNPNLKVNEELYRRSINKKTEHILRNLCYLNSVFLLEKKLLAEKPHSC